MQEGKKISEYTVEEALEKAGLLPAAYKTPGAGVLMLWYRLEDREERLEKAYKLLETVASVLRQVKLIDGRIPPEVAQAVAEARDRLAEEGYTGR